MKENGFDVADVSELNSSTNDLISTQGLMQTKAQYTTAVQVIKKRNLNEVILEVEKEAALAEDEFYYSWGQGKGYIEGLSIGGALIIARNWGNSAVNVRVEEGLDNYIFYGDFIDFQTGFNLTRPFRMAKKVLKKRDGSAIYDQERNDDIVFQIGASKCMRNVISNGVPKYLVSKGIEKAKDGVKAKLTKMGVAKATGKVIERAEKLKVPSDRIEMTYGKKEKWDIDKLVMISGALRTVEDGYGSIEDVFPLRESSKSKDVEVTTGRPEVEKAEIVEDKQPEKKTEKKSVEKKEEAVVIDWENPASVVDAVNALYNDDFSGQEIIGNITAFKKNNRGRLQQLDNQEIYDALEKVEKLALGKK